MPALEFVPSIKLVGIEFSTSVSKQELGQSVKKFSLGELIHFLNFEYI